MEGKEANDTEAPSTADIADTAVPVPASAHEVPAVVTMPAQSSSATGSADGAAPPPSAPSTADIPAPVSSVTPEGANKDITQQFAPGSETANPKQITVKDQFLAADLIVPAITLKKTKQALSSAEAERTARILGVLGESSITSYRVEKKGSATHGFGRLWQVLGDVLGKSFFPFARCQNCCIDTSLQFGHLLGIGFLSYCK